MSKRVVILATEGNSTRYLYNYLKEDVSIEKVLVEQNVSKKVLLKNRIKRIGFFKVFGQVLFILFVPKLLSVFSKKRITEIENEFGLNNSLIPSERIVKVDSVNDNKTISLLNSLQPDIILVNGTRIIKANVISKVNCKFINVHAGITPKYRGVHGGYWALFNNDPEHCGVTVHFVDEGIDTGEVLAQTLIYPGKKDNYITYPILQIGEGLKLLKYILLNFDNTELSTPKTEESNLWYHPTIWQYLNKRISKNIK